MKLKIYLERDAIQPARAHQTDAGMDLFSREDARIIPYSGYCFDTGVHIELPPDCVGFLKSKSGLNVKQGITSTGTIDEGYVGSIVVKLYNNSDEIVRIKKCQKISQLVILPIIKPEYEEVEDLCQLYNGKTERGNNGFGSTGKF